MVRKPIQFGIARYTKTSFGRALLRRSCRQLVGFSSRVSATQLGQLADTCLTICCPTFSVGVQTSNQNKNPLRLSSGGFYLFKYSSQLIIFYVNHFKTFTNKKHIL